MLNRLNISNNGFSRLSLGESQNKKFNSLDLSEGSFGRTFITLWNTANTDATSSSDVEVHLPVPIVNITSPYRIEWGDGTFDYSTTTTNHTYTIPGIYEIRCVGAVTDWKTSISNDKIKLLEIIAWGGFEITKSSFENIQNLIIRPHLT